MNVSEKIEWMEAISQNTSNQNHKMYSLYSFHQIPGKWVWLCLHQCYAEPPLCRLRMCSEQEQPLTWADPTISLSFTGVGGLKAASFHTASDFTS